MGCCGFMKKTLDFKIAVLIKFQKSVFTRKLPEKCWQLCDLLLKRQVSQNETCDFCVSDWHKFVTRKEGNIITVKIIPVIIYQYNILKKKDPILLLSSKHLSFTSFRPVFNQFLRCEGFYCQKKIHSLPTSFKILSSTLHYLVCTDIMCSLFTITQGKKDHTSLATSTFGTHDVLTGHELGQHCFRLLVPCCTSHPVYPKHFSELNRFMDPGVRACRHSKPKGGGRHGTERLCVAHSPGLPGLRLSVSWWAHHLLLWVAPPQAPWFSGLTGSDHAASVWLSSPILCLRTWHNRSCDLQQGTRK